MTIPWTLPEIRQALGAAPRDTGPEAGFLRVWTDSRTIQAGDLFVALVGERFDGHDFVEEAIQKGAAGIVASRGLETGGRAWVFVVQDTLRALGELAHHRRRHLRARVVGITGSSGKTGTKDFLRTALEGSLRAHVTRANLNNRIGLPLTLLETPAEAEAVVLEMGTNEPGEIRALTRVASPDIGVITTVSETHLEKLGSLEGVLEEKLDLLRGLPEDGQAVVGDDPPLLAGRARNVASDLLVTGWGPDVSPENRPEDAEPMASGCYRFRWRGETVELQVPGRHAVYNALLALAVADLLGVRPEAAARGVGRARAGEMRSEVRSLGDLTLLVDCYNANPQSLRAALDLLTALAPAGRRVAVLGSMLELGERTRSLHRQGLEEALSMPLDLIVALGGFAEAASAVERPQEAPELRTAADLQEATAILLDVLDGTEVLLLKASRGVALERLLPVLEDRFGRGEVA